MSRPVDRRHLVPMLTGATLILGTLALVGGRQTPAHIQRLGELPMQERLLSFEDGEAGSVLVRDARTGAVLQRFAQAEGGFVRGAIRALVRERRQEARGPEAPFRLAAWADGQVSLDDMATGRRIDLTAFGATNTAVFTRLLAAQGETR